MKKRRRPVKGRKAKTTAAQALADLSRAILGGQLDDPEDAVSDGKLNDTDL